MVKNTYDLVVNLCNNLAYMTIMSEVLPYYKTRAGKTQFSSKTFNDVNYKIHPLFIAIYLMMFVFQINTYFSFIKTTI